MPYKKYNVKKSSYRFRKALQNRYVKKKSGYFPNIDAITKDIKALKSMVNAEKKRDYQSTALQSIGQSNGAVTQGAYAFSITPNPAQGTTSQTRTGNSIKWHSSFMNFQLSQLGSTVANLHACIYIVKVKGTPYTSPDTALTDMFLLNPFVLDAGTPAIIDYNSNTDPDFLSSFQVLAKKRITLKSDNYSGQPGFLTFRMGLKLKDHHVRFAADGSTTISTGQVLMFVLCDSGNASASVACTLTGANQTAVSTGFSLSYAMVHYYYDN